MTIQSQPLSFKFQLEKMNPRLGPGGITRGASVKLFPASTGLAGVSMRLQPGAMRELHWHANAAEWAYVVSGNVRTTVIHPDGTSHLDYFSAGDVWYFPRGYGHALQCMGPGECHFILIFDNGDFSEDHTFSITDFVSSVPPEIAAQNLNLTVGEVGQLHQGEAYFAQSDIPDFSHQLMVTRKTAALVSTHRYPLSAQQPRIFSGGSQQVVTVNEFPVSTTMAGSILELQPGALRELHWHPNADEWQYFLEGEAEMGVFLAEGNFTKDHYEAGDIGYAPMGAGHYIKNTGEGILKVLIGFNNGRYEAIDLSTWVASNPTDLLQGNFSSPATIVNKFPRQEEFAIRG